MNIKIWDDKYAIKSDSKCYRLIELKEGDEDIENEEGSTVGYFSTMSGLFRGVVEREGRLNKCSTLEGYVRHIEKVNKKLEENLLAIAAIVGKKEAFERVMNSIPEDIPDCITELKPEKKKKEKKS